LLFDAVHEKTLSGSYRTTLFCDLVQTKKSGVPIFFAENTFSARVRLKKINQGAIKNFLSGCD
jgi:hypothetical protein